jgi:hypothetical protein
MIFHIVRWNGKDMKTTHAIVPQCLQFFFQISRVLRDETYQILDRSLRTYAKPYHPRLLQDIRGSRGQFSKDCSTRFFKNIILPGILIRENEGFKDKLTVYWVQQWSIILLKIFVVVHIFFGFYQASSVPVVLEVLIKALGIRIIQKSIDFLMVEECVEYFRLLKSLGNFSTRPGRRLKKKAIYATFYCIMNSNSKQFFC